MRATYVHFLDVIQQFLVVSAGQQHTHFIAADSGEDHRIRKDANMFVEVLSDDLIVNDIHIWRSVNNNFLVARPILRALLKRINFHPNEGAPIVLFEDGVEVNEIPWNPHAGESYVELEAKPKPRPTSKAVGQDDHLEVGRPEASSSRVSNRFQSPLPRRRRVEAAWERSRSRTPVRRRLTGDSTRGGQAADLNRKVVDADAICNLVGDVGHYTQEAFGRRACNCSFAAEGSLGGRMCSVGVRVLS